MPTAGTMVSTVNAPRSRTALTSRIGGRMPLWAAVVCSRLLVLAAGVTGALFTKRVPNWALADPHRVTLSLGSVGNVLAAATFRWDGLRYVTIAARGYTRGGNTVSFPLYSLLIRIVSWVVPSLVIAGALVSLASLAIALILLHRIASEELGRRVADATVLLLAFAPLSFFFSAVYTESLFLALSVGAFYLARQQRFTLACAAAAGASLTHVEGVLLVAPIALMYWRSAPRPFGPRQLFSHRLLPLALPPLALLGFLAYLHANGWGWLAPFNSHNLAGYGRETLTPPVALWKAFEAGITGLSQTLHGARPIAPNIEAPFSIGFQNVVYLIVLMITAVSLVATWRRLPKEYALYATLVIIVCTWTGVVGRPLEAFDRYMLVVFPLWMGAAAWLEERRLTPIVLGIGTVMLIFYTVEFSRWVFIA